MAKRKIDDERNKVVKQDTKPTATTKHDTTKAKSQSKDPSIQSQQAANKKRNQKRQEVQEAKQTVRLSDATKKRQANFRKNGVWQTKEVVDPSTKGTGGGFVYDDKGAARWVETGNDITHTAVGYSDDYNKYLSDSRKSNALLSLASEMSDRWNRSANNSAYKDRRDIAAQNTYARQYRDLMQQVNDLGFYDTTNAADAAIEMLRAGKQQSDYYKQFGSPKAYQDAVNSYQAAEEEKNRLRNINPAHTEMGIRQLEARLSQAQQAQDWLNRHANPLDYGGDPANMPEIAGAEEQRRRLEEALGDYGSIDNIKNAIVALQLDVSNAKSLSVSESLAAKGSSPYLEGYKNIGASAPDNIVEYSRQNADAIDQPTYGDHVGEFDRVTNEGADSLYKYMTQQEVDIYNALWGHGDKEDANTYLSTLTDTLNYRKASGTFTDYLEGNPALEYLFGAAAGIEQAGTGITSIFNEDIARTTSSTQYASQMAREDLANLGINTPFGSLGQVAYDVVNTTANQIPSMAAGAAANVLLPGSGFLVQSGTLGVSAGGSSYAEKLKMGFNKEQAAAYGVLSGASEVVMESLLGGVTGGIEGLGGIATQNAIKQINANLDTAIARAVAGRGVKTIVDIGVESASEFLEEYIQEVITPVLEDIALGTASDVNLFSADALYSGIMGALSAGVMHGSMSTATSVANKISDYDVGNRVKAAAVAAERIQNIGNTMSASSVAHELAGRITEDSKPSEIGRLLREIGAEMTATETEEFKKALTDKGLSDKDAGTWATVFSDYVNGSDLTKGQLDAMNSNESIAQVFRETILDKNSTINQRRNALESVWNDIRSGEAATTESTAPKAESPAADENGVATPTEDEDAEYDENAPMQNTATGQSVKPVGFESVGKQASVKTESGDVVPLNQVAFKDDAQAIAVNSLARTAYSPQDATAIYNLAGADAGYQTIQNLTTAYNYGLQGYPFADIQRQDGIKQTSVQLIREAYTIGHESRMARSNKTLERMRVTSKTKAGRNTTGLGKVHLTEGVDTATMTARQSAGVKMAEFMSKAVGNTYVFYKGAKQDHGNIIFTDPLTGKEMAVPKTANGWSEGAKGTIYINVDTINGSEGTTLFTLAHELTHYIADWSPAKFAALQEFLFDEYSKSERGQATTLEELVNAKKKSYLDVGVSLDEADAAEEVTANMLETVLSSGRVAEQLAELSKKDQSLYDKIQTFIHDFIAKVRDIVNAYIDAKPDASHEMAAEMLAAMDKIEDMFADALWEAGENFREVTQILGDDAEVQTNSEGQMTIAEGEDGTIMHNYLTWNEGGKNALIKALKKEGYDQADIDAAVEIMDEKAKLVQLLGEEYAAQGQRNAVTVVTDIRTGKSVMSALIKNGEYPVNVDLSTICKKRVAYQRVINWLCDNGLIEQVTVDSLAIAKINDILGKYGFETACRGCFVESRRIRIQEWAETICHEWNEQVDEIRRERGMGSAGYFDFHKGTDQMFVKDMSDAEVDALHNDLTKTVKYGKGGATKRMGILLREEPSLLHHLSYADLLSPDGREAIKATSADLHTIITMRYGSNTPKIIQEFTPYTSELAEYGKKPKKYKTLRDYLYAIGGARVQSFSDFIVENWFDYAQMVADLAARKLPMHGYTKEIAFAKLFGMTGIKVNMSLIPDIDQSMGKEFAGLTRNEDGELELIFADKDRNKATGGKTYMQSINASDAFALQNDPRYSGNVGTILIGVSDAQIRMALNAPRIRMVIPYHSSGMNPVFAKMVGIQYYTDYTSVQNSTIKQLYDAKGNKIEAKLEKDARDKLTGGFEWNAVLQRTGDARAAADEYVKWCADKSKHKVKVDGVTYYAELEPKFGKFVGEPNYYKLLADFNCYDCITEEAAPQDDVTQTYPEEFESVLRGELTAQANYRAKTDAVFDDAMAEITEYLSDHTAADTLDYAEANGIKLSDKDIKKGKDARKARAAEAGVKKKFSMSEPIEETRDLIAVHGLTAQNLKDSLDLGGLPMPSIAIVKADQGHTMYGDISLLFANDTIDPKADKRNKVYGADAYTPTARDARVESEVNSKEFDRLKNKIKTLSSKVADGMFANDPVSGLLYFPYGFTSKTREEVIADLAGANVVKAAYVASIGKDFEPVYTRPYTGKLTDSQIDMMLDRIGEDTLTAISLRDINGVGKGSATDAQVYAALDVMRDIWAEQSSKGFADRQYDRMKSWPIERTVQWLATDAAYVFEYQSYKSGKTFPDIDMTLERLRSLAPFEAVEEWLDKEIGSAVGKKTIKKPGVSKFKSDGTLKSFKQTHMDYTLENIVKAMSKANDRGIGINGSSAQGMQSVAAKSYKSIKDIKKDSFRLEHVDDALYGDMKDSVEEMLYNAFGAIVDDLNGRLSRYDVEEIAVEAARGSHTIAGIQTTFARYGYRVSGFSSMLLRDAIKMAAEMPTMYFEAKPKRAVDLSEIRLAIIPDTISYKLVERLDELGIPYEYYTAGSDQSRIDVMNRQNDLMFSMQENGEELPYSRTALLTEETVDRYLREYASKVEPNYAQAYITMMLPEHFLTLTTKNGLERANIDLQTEKLDSKKAADALKNQPAFLRIDRESGRVIGHEGRHRLNAMDLDGIRRVPVLIFDRTDMKGKHEIDTLELKGEFNPYNRASLSNLIPLSYANREAIVNAFTKHTESYERMGERLGIRQTMRWSQQETDSMTDRELLANALETISASGKDVKIIKKCKATLDKYTDMQDRLAKLKKRIHDISFTKGSDRTDLNKMLDTAKDLREALKKYDQELLKLESTEPIQRLLEEERSKLRTEMDAKARADAREMKKLEAQLVRNKERYHNLTVNRQNTVLRHKIQKTVNQLNEYLLKPSKEKHVMVGMQKMVATALDAINMDTLSAPARLAELYAELDRLQNTQPKRKKPGQTDWAHKEERIEKIKEQIQKLEKRAAEQTAKLSELHAAYTAIKTDPDPLVAVAFDETVQSAITAAIEICSDENRNQVALIDMNSEQLETVYKLYTMILHNVRNANKVFAGKRAGTLAEYGEATIGELRNSGKFKPRDGNSLLSTLNKFDWNNQKPYYAFNRFGSSTMMGLYESLRTGTETYATDIAEAKEQFRKVADHFGYRKWKMDKTYSFESMTGKKFDLSLNQIMSIYAYSKRPAARGHLLGGGIELDSDGIENAEVYSLTEQILGEIIAKLEPEQRKFVDLLQHYLSKTMGAKGNEVSLTLYGIKMFGEDNYFPIRSSSNFTHSEMTESGEVKLRNSSFTKALVEHARNPIILGNFTDVWADHVAEMSLYHGMVLPLEDLNRVYQFKQNADNSPTGVDISVKQLIKGGYGSQALKYVETLIRELNGGVRTDDVASIGNRLLSNFKKGAVFASLSVVIQQPSAIGRSLKYLDLIDFVGGGKSTVSGGVYEEAKRYSPVAIIKEMGGFDTNVGMGTRDYLTTLNPNGIAGKGKAFLTDSSYRDEVFGYLPGKADEITWSRMWQACKNHVLRENRNLKRGSEEHLKAAGALFTKIVDETQVYDSTLSRSANMRSKDTWAKMITAFMAEPTTTVNMMQDAIVEMKRGNLKVGRKALAGCITAQVINAALASIIYAMRDDDEDQTYLEKYAESLMSELAEGANILNMIPLASDIVSLIQGYDVNRTDMDQFAKLFKLAEKESTEFGKFLDGEDNDIAGASRDVLLHMAQMLGIPLKNIYRDASAIYRTALVPSKEHTTKAGLLNSVRNGLVSQLPKQLGKMLQRTTGEQLYDAVMSGDTEQFNRLIGRYKDNKSVDKALRDALRTSDPRIREAAMAKMAGNLAEYSKLVKAIKGEGKFSQDVIIGAVNNDITKLSKNDDVEDTVADGGNDTDTKGLFTNADLTAAVSAGNQTYIQMVVNDMIDTKVRNGKTEEEAKSSIKTDLNKALKAAVADGVMSSEAASNVLTDVLGMSEDDADSYADSWEFAAQHGFSYSDLADEYKAGNVSEADARQILAEHGGKSDKEINNWIGEKNFEKKYGFSWSDRGTVYKNGEISASELKQAIMDITGKSETDAALDVAIFDWQKEVPECDDITGSAIEDYNMYCQSAGISKDAYYKAWKEYNATDGEVDGSGKSIPYSRVKKYFPKINAMPLTASQKTTIARLWWGESTVNAYKMW